MQNLDDVYSRQHILAAIEKVNHEVSRKFSPLSYDDFYTRFPGKWSPYDTLRHLIKSVELVALAMNKPKFILAIKFGKSDRSSLRFAQIKNQYFRVLDKGIAVPDYAPTFEEIPGSEAEAEKSKRLTLAKWGKTDQRLIKVVTKWVDLEFDKYLLPHPLLGEITARELLFTTMCHTHHHVNSLNKLLKKNKKQ